MIGQLSWSYRNKFDMLGCAIHHEEVLKLTLDLKVIKRSNSTLMKFTRNNEFVMEEQNWYAAWIENVFNTFNRGLIELHQVLFLWYWCLNSGAAGVFFISFFFFSNYFDWKRTEARQFKNLGYRMNSATTFERRRCVIRVHTMTRSTQ